MTTQLIAILASAGLLSAGVAGAAQTRSSAAIPVASMVSVSKARVAPGLSVARQGGPTNCSLRKNKSLPACAEGGTGTGSGAGYVLGVAGAGLLGAGIYFAARNDSNG